MELWNLALAAIFFCAMGTFAGVAALYLTSTPFFARVFAHQAAEIVLFCLLFAIALFAVIALFVEKTSSPSDQSKQKIGAPLDTNCARIIGMSPWASLSGTGLAIGGNPSPWAC